MEETPVRIIVDDAACCGSGRCASIAPQLFELTPDAETVSVRQPSLYDPKVIALAREAAESCPNSAIVLEQVVAGP